MVCRALLAARSPPRAKRCRVIFPDEAGTGAVPHSAAKDASLVRRPGFPPGVPRYWWRCAMAFSAVRTILLLRSPVVLGNR